MDLNTIETVLPADRGAIDGWMPGDAWLAGGTWLFSEPQPALRRLIDLDAFEWPALTAGDDGLEIAATCKLVALAAWAAAPSPDRPEWPAIAVIPECCRALLGSFKVWNAATVGGNMCLGLAAGPMISLAVGLDGICTVWEPGQTTRLVDAGAFVLGPGETALAPGALLRSILLPASALRCMTAFRRLSLTPIGRSAVVAIGRAARPRGEVVITLTAAVPRPVQLRFAAPPTAEECQQALDDAEIEYYDDAHGAPAWREHLCRTYAEEIRQELELSAAAADRGSES